MVTSDSNIRHIFECSTTLADIASSAFENFAALENDKFKCSIAGKEKTCNTRDQMIQYLVNECSEELCRNELDAFAWIISKAQEYIRSDGVEGDPSAVSLRDVNRILLLFQWFHDNLSDSGSKIPAVARAAVLALAHVYWYRLLESNHREGLWQVIAANSVQPVVSSVTFSCLTTSETLQAVVARAHTLFVENLDVEEGVFMNQALSENVFVTIVCILNRIPCFIVGKPGTSKTLAVQVIESNLQGAQSPKPFWRNYPAINLFQYQCSPMSTTQSIKKQYDAAKASQEQSIGVITVLLLDEVGLAEYSPDMPLKVLHSMLVDPPIAIVGVSNWALDSSKMNRAILLQR